MKTKTGKRDAASAAAEVVDEVAEGAGVEVTPELEAAVEEAIQGAVDTATEDAAAEAEETADDETPAEDAGETVEEQSRAAAILDLCTRHGLSVSFAARHLKAGTTIHQVRTAVLDAIAARSAPNMTTARVTRDARETVLRHVSAAQPRARARRYRKGSGTGGRLQICF